MKGKTQRMIAYTSDAEGITVAVIGDTWMDCLLGLAEDVGDGVMVLHEATMEEFEQTAAAVAESYAGTIEAVTKRQVEEPLAERTVSPAAEAERAARALARAEREAEQEAKDAEIEGSLSIFHEDGTEPPGGGAGQDQTASGTGAQRGGSTAMCEVCGAETTADHAELAVILHGEKRCPDCMP